MINFIFSESYDIPIFKTLNKLKMNKLFLTGILLSLFVFSKISFSQSGKANETEKSVLTIEERVTKLESEVSELRKKINRLTGNEASTPESKNTTKENTSDNKKPNEQNVNTAISNYLKKEVPVTWAGNLLGGSNGVASSITVMQWGNYNEQYKYWPVKVRVIGSCTVENLMGVKENKSFDKTGNFKIYTDDYGVWTAQYAESF